MSLSDWSFNKFGKKKDAWPKGENGEPVKPAFLMHVTGSQMDYEMSVSLLKAYGIPIFGNCPNDGDFGKIIMGLSGTGTDIYVPESMLEDARNIISSTAVPEDGEPEDGGEE